MKKLLLPLLFLALPAVADEANTILSVVLRYHFERTQPFYRGQSIVAAVTRPAAATDRQWALRGIVEEAAAVRIAAALASQPQTPIALDASDHYEVVDLTRFANRAGYDWKAIARERPEIAVLFQASRPVFDPDTPYAVVRLDFIKLRGAEAGLSFSMLYGVERETSGTWRVIDFLSPCCEGSS